MEIKELKWYFNQDISKLNSNQRNIVKEMRVINLKKNIDIKNNIKLDQSILKSFNHLYSKGYKKVFCDVIVYKVYYGHYNIVESIIDYIARCESKREKITYKTYIFKDNTGIFKIGRSKNPLERHKNLERTNLGLKIIFIFNIDIELELHHKYSEKLISNEWFNLTNSDLSEIYNSYSEYEVYLK